MSDPTGEDPLELLRRANPVDRGRLPSASLDRVRARVQEATMIGKVDTPRHAPPARVTLAGLAVALTIALAVLVMPRSVPPVASPSPSGPSAIGLCVERYDLDTLRNRTLAFDGTVLTMDGGETTLRINEPFRGVDAEIISVIAPGQGDSSIPIVGGPAFEVGGRYLVSGDERFAWGCGFTQPYDPDTAAAWREALSR